MNHTLLANAESLFCPSAHSGNPGRLAEIRIALKARERALRIVEKQTRMAKRAATKSSA